MPANPKGPTMHDYHRQGDVSLIPVTTKFQVTCDPRAPAILAHGEATGHTHVMERGARITRDPDVIAALTKELIDKGILLPEAKTVKGGVIVDEPTMLKHEEHGTQNIARGRYALLQEQEYTPAEIKTVHD